jgi:hypothetical protein
MKNLIRVCLLSQENQLDLLALTFSRKQKMCKLKISLLIRKLDHPVSTFSKNTRKMKILKSIKLLKKKIKFIIGVKCPE